MHAPHHCGGWRRLELDGGRPGGLGGSGEGVSEEKRKHIERWGGRINLGFCRVFFGVFPCFLVGFSFWNYEYPLMMSRARLEETDMVGC